MATKMTEVPLKVFEFTATSVDQFNNESTVSRSLFGKAASWRIATVYGGMRWRQPVTISIKPRVERAQVVAILRCMADALEASPQDPIVFASYWSNRGPEYRGWYDPGNHAFVDILSNTVGTVSHLTKSVGSWCSSLFSKKRP